MEMKKETEHYKNSLDSIVQSIEKNAWDGSWYLEHILMMESLWFKSKFRMQNNSLAQSGQLSRALEI